MRVALAAVVVLLLVVLATAVVTLFRLGQLQADLANLKVAVEKRDEREVLARPSVAAASMPVSFNLNLKDRPTLGDEKAKITIVEFIDYECPFCNRFNTNTFGELKRRYIDTGQVRYVVYDLPLRFHDNATKAAQAARCANEQDHYLAMRAKLFANAKSLQPDKITSYAKEAALDLTRFRTCFGSDRYLFEIQNDAAAASAAGISGTPSFLIGPTTDGVLSARKVVGAAAFPIFEKYIKDASG